MDYPTMETVATMALSMTAETIVGYYRERGIDAAIVTGGIYPIGIKLDDSTLFIPALQPVEVKVVSD